MSGEMLRGGEAAPCTPQNFPGDEIKKLMTPQEDGIEENVARQESQDDGNMEGNRSDEEGEEGRIPSKLRSVPKVSKEER